jgi:hypothetical protein
MASLLPTVLPALYVGHKVEAVNSSIRSLEKGISCHFEKTNKTLSTISSQLDDVSSQMASINGQLTTMSGQLVGISSQLDRLVGSVESLSGKIDNGFSSVVHSLNMIHNTAIKGFKDITSILSAPNKTLAKEHFLDGIELYNMSCRFPDKHQFQLASLKHLSTSVDLYEINPIAYFVMGNLCSAFDGARDLQSATKFFILASDYGEAMSLYRLASLCLSNASLIIADTDSDMDKALSLARNAVELYPRQHSSRYNLLILLQHSGKMDECIQVATELVKDTNGAAYDVFANDESYRQVFLHLSKPS